MAENKKEFGDGGPTPTVRLNSPLVSVSNDGIQRGPVDPLSGMPVWAKIAGTLSAVGLVFALFTFLVLNMVRSQGRDAETLERLVDKFDHVLEKHDGRMTEWMRSQADRNDSAHEKTRAELRMLVDEKRRALEEQLRMHNEAMSVLRKIANKESSHE